MNMKRISIIWSMLLILVLTLLAGCAGGSGLNAEAAILAVKPSLVQ